MSKIKDQMYEQQAEESHDENENALTVTTLMSPSNDGWDTVPDSGNRLIVGGLIKYKDDEWFADKVEFDVSDRTFAVVAVRSVWVKFGDEGEKPEQRITLPGQKHPDRNELGDLDETKWALGLDGKTPEDPWRDSRYTLLIDTVSAEQFTYVTDTFGGRRAIADLRDQIVTIRRVHPGAIPIVKLTGGLMKTKYGPKPRPVLKVVGWQNVAAEAPKPIAAKYAADRVETHAARMAEEKRDDMRDEIPF
jgi:hypothetical protein